jgi:hypothetical protein
MKSKIIVGVLIVIFVFLVVRNRIRTEEEASIFNEFDQIEVKEIVSSLNMITSERTDISASITSDILTIRVLNDDEKNVEKVYSLPEEEFYVSIAPYLNNTHECYTHSIIGCRGELVKQEFEVIFTADTGEILLNEKMLSQQNGFIDLWLPRNINGTLTVRFDNLIAEQSISTFSGDRTCITTLKLN